MHAKTIPVLRLILTLCLALVPLTASAARPHLELDVRLEPDTRRLAVTATLSGVEGSPTVALDPALTLEQMEADGRRQRPPAARTAHGQRLYRLPAARRLTLRYTGTLAPLAEADHRRVLGRLPAMADPEGSFLPAGSGWYPHPGEPFTYRLTLGLPAGQKGLVPGELLEETANGKGYRAVFDFPQPAEGIDLMAGPYQVSERSLALDDGKRVKLRTWFHAELADQAAAYLSDTATYIRRYSRQIGAYPFGMFSVVSAPLPTGFGMPGLTYLGREVLKLPFIRATSLGHEVLHNWWGNGVYPDWERGNWSEGLTTFMADYAYREDQSPEAAREMRLGWLRDLAAVPEAEDTALKDFTARHHGISSIVGYNKAAMVFLMLRDRIGREAFDRGLRLFWLRHRFKTAGWADLEKALSEVAGQDLGGFFRQWVERPGAPRLKLLEAQARDGDVMVQLAQEGDYPLRVPLELLVFPDKREAHWLDLDGKAGGRIQIRLTAKGLAQAVDLDPDYRLWRRVDKALFPPILREVFVAPGVGLLIASGDPAMAEAARTLAGRLADARPVELPASLSRLPDEGATLIIGDDTRDLLQRLSLAARPLNVAGKGTAQVWAGRDELGHPYAVITARNAESLAALARPLPHYGKQSWLVFLEGKVADKGVWPPSTDRVRVENPATGPAR